MHPNGSEQVRTGPSKPENLEKLAKTSKNSQKFREIRENFEKFAKVNVIYCELRLEPPKVKF